jgi:hypothetical protein
MNFDADDQKKIMDLIMEFFKQDIVKTCNWFMTVNPLLGNIAPVVMLKLGRTDKLLKLIQSLKEENGW